MLIVLQVTYLGWWGQRYLREKFIERVKDLVPPEPLRRLSTRAAQSV